MKKIVVAGACALACACAMAAPVDEARTLLAKGEAAAASTLLEATLDQHLADVDYNVLLGIALLDANKPGEAVFAFERVLAMEPGHALARAELARAMMALTEYDAARTELQQVRRAAIPTEVAVRVDATLAELDRVIAAKALSSGGTVLSAYLEAEIGHDTNINTATNSNSVLIPLFGLPASLTGFARSQASAVIGLNGGLSAQKRVADGVDIYGGVDLRLRYHPDRESYAPAALAVGGGVRWTRGIDQFSLGASQFAYYIGQNQNDDLLSLYGQWQRQLDRQNAASVFAQYTRAKHPIAHALDTDLYLLGANWTHAFDAPGSPHITFSGWVADDKERGQDITVGRTFAGAKLGVDYTPRDNWKLFGSLSAQSSRYGGISPFFGVKRSDERYDLSLGASYKPDKQWTYSAQLTHTRNQSNVAINDFSRDLLLFTVRRDF